MKSIKIYDSILNSMFSIILLTQGLTFAQASVNCQDLLKKPLQVKTEKNRVIIQSDIQAEYKTAGEIISTQLATRADRVAILKTNEFIVVDRLGKVIAQEFWQKASIVSMTITPDGKYLAFATPGSDRTRIYLFDVDKKTIVRQINVLKMRPDLLRISNDAQRIATVDLTGRVITSNWIDYSIQNYRNDTLTDIKLSEDGKNLKVHSMYDYIYDQNLN